MGIDFGDFLVGNPSVAAAGQAAPAIVSAYQQGIKDYAQAQSEMAQLRRLEHQIKMDDFELQNKMEDRPLDRLAKMQKVNVAPVEAEAKDYDEAAKAMKEAGLLAFDEAGALSSEAKVELMARAKEIAQARRVPMDPLDPENWMSSVRTGETPTLSDFEADLMKSEASARAMMQRDLLKAERQAEIEAARAAERMRQFNAAEEGRMARQENQIKSSEKRTQQTIAAAFGRQANQQQFQQSEQKKKQAHKAKDALYRRMAVYASPGKNPEARKKLLAGFNAIKQMNVPEVTDEIYVKYKDVLQASGYEPGVGSGVANPSAGIYNPSPRARPKAKPVGPQPYNPGKQYKVGEEFVIQGKVMKVLPGGKFKRIK